MIAPENRRIGVLSVFASLLFLCGLSVVLEPTFTILVMSLGVLVAVLIGFFHISSPWHLLASLALAGYVVLNYGFANLALPVGDQPIPVGHSVAFLALLFVARGPVEDLLGFFRLAVVRSWMLLFTLAVAHLVFDLASYGAYAVRDVSFVAEGIFMLLGYLWAFRDKRTFLHTLAVVFVINLAYAFTFPFAEYLQKVSPVSGIFLQVPLLGSYAHTPLILLFGALFFAILGRTELKLQGAVVWSLVVLQAGWSLVFQTRVVYVGLVLAVLLIQYLRGFGAGIRILASVGVGVLGLLLVVSVLNLQIPGRVGEVDVEFFTQHVRSIFLEPGTPAEGSARWRLELLPAIWERWTASAGSVVFGEGMGNPLIDFYLQGGIAVRQPHNTHLTVLLRLGLVGFFIWGLMHWKIISSFRKALRRVDRRSSEHALVLWLLLFYVLGMLMTSFQPWLEFSYGAIPFFVVLGFFMGWLQQDKNHGGSQPQLPMRVREFHV